MKKYLLSILLASSSAVATAQSYTISPSTTIIDTALCNQLNLFTIFQDNISGGTLNLGWTFISNNMPGNWTLQFCDNSQCQSLPITSGIMNPVAAGGQGLVTLDVVPNTPGVGTFTVYVYDLANPSNGDTLTWIIYSDCPVGIAEQSSNSNISVFPNPVTDYLNVKLADYSSPVDQLIIYNALGLPLYEKSLQGSKNQRLNVSAFPAGVYTLVLIDQNGKQVTKSFIK